MQKDLNYDYLTGQECLHETIQFDESTRDYYKFVADCLGCGIDELGLVQVHCDFADTDEEGWEIDSFFPAGCDKQVRVLCANFETPSFNIGEVLEIIYNGEKFIADHNASPFGVWAKIEDNDEISH